LNQQLQKAWKRAIQPDDAARSDLKKLFIELGGFSFCLATQPEVKPFFEEKFLTFRKPKEKSDYISLKLALKIHLMK
jgi:hypothetical protein